MPTVDFQFFRSVAKGNATSFYFRPNSNSHFADRGFDARTSSAVQPVTGLYHRTDNNVEGSIGFEYTCIASASTVVRDHVISTILVSPMLLFSLRRLFLNDRLELC